MTTEIKPIPAAVAAAFKHVRDKHPEVCQVFFGFDGRWQYMDADFNTPSFGEDIDTGILEDAAVAAEHANGVPCAYLDPEFTGEEPPEKYGDTALRCPACGNTTDDFRVTAWVQINVSATDYTTITEQDNSDTEYGSDDRCECTRCHHAGLLHEFRRADQDDKED
jgi:hypothetical protein